MTYRHVTAPTQFVEANGIRFAYRRFGQEGGTPLLFMQHFRGGMDHWDPAVTDGFAKNRPPTIYNISHDGSVMYRRDQPLEHEDAKGPYTADHTDVSAHGPFSDIARCLT